MKIAVIGTGAMGGAIVRGLMASGYVEPKDITAANPHTAKLDDILRQGANVTTDNRAAVKDADIVVIAVKPWLAESVIEEIKPSMDYARQKVVSVVFGPSGRETLSWLEKEEIVPPLFLVIPNTAIAVRRSMTFVVPVNASAGDTEQIVALFDNLGKVQVVEERLLPAASALASCGIAFAMRYVRAASEGGVELGFKADTAKDIVLQTLLGTASLLAANGNHPEAEIDKVTTPGGVTIRGLNEMEHAGFTSAVIRGLKATVGK